MSEQVFLTPEEILKNIKDCFEILDEYEKIINNINDNSTPKIMLSKMKEVMNDFHEYAKTVIASNDTATLNVLALDSANRKIELFEILEGLKYN